MSLLRKVLATLAIAFVFSPAVLATPAPENENFMFGDDTFAFGNIVRLVESLPHSLIAAGGEVEILSHAEGDIFAVGETVRLNAAANHEAYLAGNRVEIGSDGKIAGALAVAGNTIDFSGEVARDAIFTGNLVRLSGSIGGDAEVYANKIVFEDGLTVMGKLTYEAATTNELKDGMAVEAEQIQASSDSQTNEKPSKSTKSSFFSTMHFVSLAASLLVGILVIWFSGRASLELAATARKRIWLSLGVGVLVLFVPFFLGLILLVTGIGSLLGVLMLLGWLITLVLALPLSGWTFVSLFWQPKVKTSTGKKILFYAGGMIALELIGLIPVFGGLVRFAFIVLTLGVCVLTKISLYKQAKKAKLV